MERNNHEQDIAYFANDNVLFELKTKKEVKHFLKVVKKAKKKSKKLNK